MRNEEIKREISFLYSITNSGNKEDIIADITSDLCERHSELNYSECQNIVKSTLSI